SLLSRIFSPSVSSIACASGRWYPQPASHRFTSSLPSINGEEKKEKGGEVRLSRESAAPLYAPPRGEKKLGIVKGKKGEILADYVLFEEAIQKVKVHWINYDGLTSKERDIHMKHIQSIEERKLSYKDPDTGYVVLNTSQLLLNGKCCGNGCRHCPYELSKHRSRPPVMGIHRRTRCMVVDNSQLGKEAHSSGKLAYCIHVYKQGFRAKHMPHATLGDKILVAIRGEMKKAFVVGANTHVHLRKHGVPVTDTNNIVLLNEEGNPLGTRVTTAIPAQLKEKVDNAQFAKVLAISNKFL
ncbi:hypothetical protein PFISCL1PPCAC_6108, partial [Pristionchus fissidentatus]